MSLPFLHIRNRDQFVAVLLASLLWSAGVSTAAPNGRIRVAFDVNHPETILDGAHSAEDLGSERGGKFDVTVPKSDVPTDLPPREFLDWVLRHTSSPSKTHFLTYLNVYHWSEDAGRYIFAFRLPIKDKSPFMQRVGDECLLLFSATLCNWSGPPEPTKKLR